MPRYPIEQLYNKLIDQLSGDYESTHNGARIFVEEGYDRFGEERICCFETRVRGMNRP